MRAVDASNNTFTGYTGTIHFTSTDGQAVLPANYTFVAGDGGSHTFTNGVTLKTAGTQTVSVNDTVTTSKTGTSGNIVVSAGAATQLVLSGATTNLTQGATRQFTATAKDAFGNTDPNYTATVTFAQTGGSGTVTGLAPRRQRPASRRRLLPATTPAPSRSRPRAPARASPRTRSPSRSTTSLRR